MGASPALLALFIPAGLFAAWLFLHKDADVEQRIDKREAIYQRESADFDKDFSKFNGDTDGEAAAKERIAAADAKIKEADVERSKREKTDQRGAVRDGVDKFLKPENKGK